MSRTGIDLRDKDADDVSLDVVARYLTEAGLPKTPNAVLSEWTDGNVISLIQCPKYRGEEVFRVEISKKNYKTGKWNPTPNPKPENVLTRPMPHLRIVDDSLWYSANQSINNRARPGEHPSGHNHPLQGIPRDSRSPLSKTFDCGICGSKMYMTGRNEGGYRCSAAVHGKCWNKTTALRDMTHQRIGTAISQAILEASLTAIPELLKYMEGRLADRGDLEKRQADLLRRQGELKRKQDRLIKAITESHDPPEFLNAEMESLKAEERQLKLDERLLQEQCSAHVAVPSREDLARELHNVANQFNLNDLATGSLLRRLVDGKIRAIPCQQIGSRKVVLRAEFTLELVQLIPANVRSYVLNPGPSSLETPEVLRRKIVVDLFEPSTSPLHAMRALELYQKDPGKPATLNQIAAQLGISKRAAHLTLKMGKQLQAEGRTDPFEPLTKCPENPARWKFKDAS